MSVARRQHVKLPDSSIEIRDGKVVRITNWAFTDHETPTPIFCLEHDGTTFTCTAAINCPPRIHSQSPDINEALAHLLVVQRKRYIAAFMLPHADEASLREIGFDDYVIRPAD